MEIGSVSNNYADILQELVADEVNQIKKATILEGLNMKVATASMVADDIATSLINGGYQMDSSIPEDSTLSYHV